MSIEDARKFYEKLVADEDARDEAKEAWGHVERLARKHGYDFTHAEFFDFVHEKTGMTKIGTSEEHDETDTCICIIPSEPPRY